MPKFAEGDEVEWNWGKGTGSGKVTDSFTRRVTRQIKGKKITRDAGEENPAYLIRQENGDRVLKSESELSRKS